MEFENLSDLDIAFMALTGRRSGSESPKPRSLWELFEEAALTPPDVQVYFNRPRRPMPLDPLLADIRKARYRLYVASAWFTSREIAQAIHESEADIKALILNRADVDRAKAATMWAIEAAGPIDLYIVGSADFTEGIMHHKFVVADSVVWVGSYNLTYQATKNFEALVRIHHAPTAMAFIAEARAMMEAERRAGDGETADA